MSGQRGQEGEATGTPSTQCPHCGGVAVLSASNPWRPFCSRRCKLIDLGDWLAEKHVIGDEDGSHPIGGQDDWQH
ncbi:DNA gyrase inhibitor YacG [Algiphilus sp.]|uniref:DNA gyrase inhibitor YacG n=1 Tax=Algiphilus sp. TaxID=1872431 RepID=UPI003B519847